jgi:predicted DNA-binding transcriptional regulator AlpA
MIVTADTTTQGKRPRRRSKARTPAAALADFTLTNDRLVTTAEAARLTGVSQKTLREWRSKRTGPAALKLGVGKQARCVYRVSSLEAWVRASVTSVTGGQS